MERRGRSEGTSREKGEERRRRRQAEAAPGPGASGRYGKEKPGNVPSSCSRTGRSRPGTGSSSPSPTATGRSSSVSRRRAAPASSETRPAARIPTPVRAGARTAHPDATATGTARPPCGRRGAPRPGPRPAKHTSFPSAPGRAGPACTASSDSPARRSAPAHHAPTHAAAATTSSTQSWSARGIHTSTQSCAPGARYTAPPPLRRRASCTRRRATRAGAPCPRAACSPAPAWALPLGGCSACLVVSEPEWLDVEQGGCRDPGGPGAAGQPQEAAAR